MSLIFNPTSGVAYLETEEAAPWASLGCRPYTHFVLLETTVSQANSQYVWSTGNLQAANTVNMWFASNGAFYAIGGTATVERDATATSPAFGGGLLRLAVIRGLGVQNSNANLDYQAINLGTQLGSSSVQISSSVIQKYTTGGANALAATKLTLGDRQTTPGDRKFFGTMHFAGSVNRALDDNELIAILKGDIQVLDYFKHDLVELWDFQRSDASALTGLISGTTFKMFGGGNLTWNQSAPLPVSRTRGYTVLGATNQSTLVPIWAFGESSTDNLINIYPSDLSLNSSVLSPLQEHSIEPRNLSLSSNPLSTLATVDIITGSVELTSSNITLAQQVLLTSGLLGLTGNDINLAQQVLLNPGAVDLSSNNIILSQHVLITPGMYTFTGNDVDAQLYINITKGSVVTQGKSILIDTGYPSINIGITQGNIALLGSNILNNIQVNVSPGSVTSSGNQVKPVNYIEILAGNASMVGSNIYIDTDFPYINIDITPSNISTLGNQVILDRATNLAINKGDIHTLGSNILVHTQADNLINIACGKLALLGSNVVVHTQADNLINIAYGSIEVLGSGVVVISGEPYDSGRRLRVTKQDYRLGVTKQDYILRVMG